MPDIILPLRIRSLHTHAWHARQGIAGGIPHLSRFVNEKCYKSAPKGSFCVLEYFSTI